MRTHRLFSMFMLGGVLVAATYCVAENKAQIATITKIDANTPRDLQIQLARSAAPPEVSDHADIYILGKKGYELAIKGSNFSCLVERENTDSLAPKCYDREGSRTDLRTALFVENERAKGIPEEKIQSAVKDGYKRGTLKRPSNPGIVYMLSEYNLVFDPDSKKTTHLAGHLMFYAPNATAESVGSGKGAPHVLNPGKPDALMIVVPAR